VLHDAAAPEGLSELGRRFAAGILTHARALLAFTAPSPTSYLRLTPHRWSSAGVFLAERNREALLRICPTSPLCSSPVEDQLNLEFRAADATANPWLVLGLLVRAGLQGIEQSYEPAHVWPETVTEAELADVSTLPKDLEDALAGLAADDVVTSWLHPDLLDTHLAVKRSELEALAGLTEAEQCLRTADVH
jgi:glutamine synthetase